MHAPSTIMYICTDISSAAHTCTHVDVVIMTECNNVVGYKIKIINLVIAVSTVQYRLYSRTPYTGHP